MSYDDHLITNDLYGFMREHRCNINDLKMTYIKLLFSLFILLKASYTFGRRSTNHVFKEYKWC